MNPLNKKRVLIITYYWPPSGGSGVQRWLKFVKYLPQFGWTPYVFTPENPSFAVQDKSLLSDVPAEAEVIHFPIWEPYDTFFKLSAFFGGKKKLAKPTDLVSGRKKSYLQKLSTWIRGNFFIPDPRIFWVRPSVKFLHQFLNENEITTIVTTGPPHSIHLIGYGLKKKNPALQWLADFRDPWTAWGLLDSLMVGSLARRIHKKLESKVLSRADKITTITSFYVKKFEALSGRDVHLLTNGFDDDDFSAIRYVKPEKFTIRHVGIVNEKCDPRPFMEAVRTLAQHNEEFRSSVIIEFIGEVHPQFKKYIESSLELSLLTKVVDNIPHKELISTYGSSSILLLILYGYKDAEGFMPGKLFEYLATGLPIMAVGPVHGDAAELLLTAKAGHMLAGNDALGIKNTLLNHFNAWKMSVLPIVNKASVQGYSRKTLTGDLVRLL